MSELSNLKNSIDFSLTHLKDAQVLADCNSRLMKTSNPLTHIDMISSNLKQTMTDMKDLNTLLDEQSKLLDKLINDNNNVD